MVTTRCYATRRVLECGRSTGMTPWSAASPPFCALRAAELPPKSATSLPSPLTPPTKELTSSSLPTTHPLQRPFAMSELVSPLSLRSSPHRPSSTPTPHSLVNRPRSATGSLSRPCLAACSLRSQLKTAAHLVPISKTSYSRPFRPAPHPRVSTLPTPSLRSGPCPSPTPKVLPTPSS